MLEPVVQGLSRTVLDLTGQIRVLQDEQKHKGGVTRTVGSYDSCEQKVLLKAIWSKNPILLTTIVNKIIIYYLDPYLCIYLPKYRCMQCDLCPFVCIYVFIFICYVLFTCKSSACVSCAVAAHPGSVFVRWGHNQCPQNTDLLYSGLQLITNKFILSTWRIIRLNVCISPCHCICNKWILCNYYFFFGSIFPKLLSHRVICSFCGLLRLNGWAFVVRPWFRFELALPPI